MINLGIFFLTLVALTTIIGMTSISLSIVFEKNSARYIPTQPTHREHSPKPSKELETDIEAIFSDDDCSDSEAGLIIND